MQLLHFLIVLMVVNGVLAAHSFPIHGAVLMVSHLYQEMGTDLHHPLYKIKPL